MKIVQITNRIGSRYTGAEKFCVELSIRLARNDHDITIVSDFSNNKSTIEDLRKEGIKCINIPSVRSVIARKLFFDYFNPFVTRKILKYLHTISPER